MKKRIRLSESRFKRLVFETAKQLMKESRRRRGKRALRESEEEGHTYIWVIYSLDENGDIEELWDESTSHFDNPETAFDDGIRSLKCCPDTKVYQLDVEDIDERDVVDGYSAWSYYGVLRGY